LRLNLNLVNHLKVYIQEIKESYLVKVLTMLLELKWAYQNLGLIVLCMEKHIKKKLIKIVKKFKI